jgi:spore maturation protein CgeB
MKVVLFCHSLISDWNHGNAHFLRGIVTELLARGDAVDVYEPSDGWSRQQLLADVGPGAIAGFHAAFPQLTPRAVDLAALDLDAALDCADMVLVHEWSPPSLAARIGRHRRRNRHYVLLFHDTHHRSVSDAPGIRALDLGDYDGVLAFGEAVRERYVRLGWGHRAWTWHEAADIRVFHPIREIARTGDLVWIGNWGDNERSEEIREYLIAPVRALGLRARVHGVRYPDDARRELAGAGIEYAGWLANYQAPRAYAAHRMAVHIPRRPYVEALPGIPTIRVFEALACGVPLVSAWWDDCEGLFEPGEDFLMAKTPEMMRSHLLALRQDDGLCEKVAGQGRATILARHTCGHRVDELMTILDELRGSRVGQVVSA